jgi:hypothetical protein
MKLMFDKEEWKELLDRVMESGLSREWSESEGIVCKDPEKPDAIFVVFDDPTEAMYWKLRWS